MFWRWTDFGNCIRNEIMQRDKEELGAKNVVVDVGEFPELW